MASQILEGELISRRLSNGAVVIDQAPPVTRISLAFLTAADPVVVKVSGRLVTLGGQVTYRVVGWDAHSHALIAEREGPWPATSSR